MSLKHNKKRNVGLVYEFLARYLAKAIIENRDVDIAKAKTIIRKNFNKQTDLYKELKLFKALSETTLPTREAAQVLINRVKEAVKEQSQQRLDLEKTSLIHEINYSLNSGGGFFDDPVDNYREMASVQVLLNHWRSGMLHEHISEVIELEESLLSKIVSPKQTADNSDILNMEEEERQGLVLGIMTEKINKKFASLLTESQRKLVQLYAASNQKDLVQSLTDIQTRMNTTIQSLLESGQYDIETNDKLTEARQLMLTEYGDVTKVNHDLVTFYMGMLKLEEELKHG